MVLYSKDYMTEQSYRIIFVRDFEELEGLISWMDIGLERLLENWKKVKNE